MSSRVRAVYDRAINLKASNSGNGESVADVLLFDLGGVLVDFAGFRELKSFVPEPIEDDEIRRRWLASPSVRAFELGVSSDEDFANDFIAEWSLELDSA